MLPPMQLDFEIDLTTDAEVLYGAADTFRLVIDRDYQKPTKWTYLREMYQRSDLTNSSGDFRISASIDKVKYVFVYLQRDKTNDMTGNPYIFGTFKLNAGDDNSTLLNCRLEYGNGVCYPELDYDSDSKSRIFSDLMNYSWKKNDYNTGTQINIANFTSLYPLIFFLSKLSS